MNVNSLKHMNVTRVQFVLFCPSDSLLGLGEPHVPRNGEEWRLWCKHDDIWCISNSTFKLGEASRYGSLSVHCTGGVTPLALFERHWLAYCQR